MFESIAILCVTFLLVLVAYWIMPNKKMKAVSKELISLVQILPISTIIKALKDNKSDDTSKGE
ncbi:hypothetical protein LB467_18095 [Salegentibacter sp. JZCK2]|uniref:hypothetical protein n=1 Tax=Salegentibacter tibetensis TaxID=2873600 RepID=UPI001CCE5F2E|nr:hypothetical protein [Salegentibacter tibetensis]MBZ9731602.1 hypothetical protein [Salegentibacter tibetensis]